MSPDQTAPKGAVSSGSILFARYLFQSIQADKRADDNCHEWPRKGFI